MWSRASLLLLACLASAGLLAATPAPSTFQPMGIDRPFQAEVITEVMQDRVGFLWIGTREGLYLYDGQRFRRFQHEVQNEASISSNGVRGIFEDSRGRLWINTITGGLNLLDRARWTFQDWRHDAANPDSLTHDGVFAVEESAGGKLWVGTQAGLDEFDPATGRFRHVVLATGGEFVMTLLRARDGRLWVGTLDQGLFRENETHDGFDPVPFQGGGEPLDVFAIAEDARGVTWIGARDGLYRFDGERAMLQRAALAMPPDKAIVNFTALQPTADGGMWVGSFGDGLYRVRAGGSRLEPVAFGPDNPSARHIDQGALTMARDGALLVGTFGAGLFRHQPGMPAFRAWAGRTDGNPGLANEDVYALLAESPGSLLAGSFGGGIDEIAIDRAGQAITHLELPVTADLQQRINGVLDLLRTRDGALWAATSVGLYRWDRARGDFHYYQPEQVAGPSRNPGYSYALLEDRQGRLWIGGGGGGVYLYLPRQDSFREFRPEPGNPRSLSGDFATALAEDRFGRVWVGTRSNAISICRLKADLLDCERIRSGPDRRQVSHDNITSLLAAPDGAIWVGTGGGGLNRVVMDDSGAITDVQRWTHDDGLADDIVMGLVNAPDGSLWLSTRGGISRMDPATSRFANLTPSDGLPTAVFNPKAALLHQGRLYFGSVKGVVSLDPAQGIVRGTPPPTVFTGVSGLADAELPAQPAWLLTALRVPWRRPFSLEFAVLGYDGGQPEFQYRLDDADDWTSLGDRGQLTLQTLPPGQHALEVRGRIAGSPWTLAPRLQLQIVPPWWRNPWLQAAGALALLGLLVGGLWWRVRELQSRNRELRRVQALREQALEEAHEGRDRLQEAFAGLRRLTMRLEAAKEQERKHIARELHDEFGQALTATKINLQLARSDPAGALVDARLGDALAGVDRLIGQVRALSLDLRPPLLDELGLLPALEAYLRKVSERSGIPVSVQLPAALPWQGGSRDIVVFRIVQEAVTNALRHSATRRLDVALAAERGGVMLRVQDHGCGFDAEAAMARADGGFGLFGMRERVHDLGGEWTLQSSPGRGTTIIAFVPGDGGEGMSGAGEREEA